VLRRKPKETVSAYSSLASIYDFVMRHVDYVHWADHVESLIVRHNLVPASMIDVACGTASLALELTKRGYRMNGADACDEMLDVARKKVLDGGHNIGLYHRSFLELEGLDRHDCVLSLYDSVNYLLNHEDMGRMFGYVHSIVHRGGLFIFDVCTETNSIRHFRDMRERERGDGFSYTRHSYYKEGIQFNDFKIRFDDPDRDVQELHQQRIYPLKEIEQVIEDSPFTLEAAYDGFSFRDPSEESDRVHFVLRA
jgi:predicted TPR repeat methyltransferase